MSLVWISLVFKLQRVKHEYIETVNNTKKNFACLKQHFVEICELFLSMLCTKLDLDPKIKVVTLVKYYNFA